MKFNRVDNNQKKLVKQIRELGGYVLHVFRIPNSFDILVGHKGKLYIIEIKNDEKGKLTEGELKCKEGFNSVGVDYHVIYNIEQFIELINK